MPRKTIMPLFIPNTNRHHVSSLFPAWDEIYGPKNVRYQI
jgi:hypothetical protein